MWQNSRCSILFHLLVPGGKWQTVTSSPVSAARTASWSFQRRAHLAVGAAGVAGDQQPPRPPVAEAALGPPPQPQRVHGERGGVAAGADGHEAPVRRDVVDAVRDDLPELLVGEVVVADLHRVPGGPPGPPGPGKRADQLLLLRVRRHHRVPGGGELRDHRVDVPELRVPVRVLPPLQHPRHPLQAVAVLPQHPRDRVLPAPETQRGQLPLQVPQRQRRPRHRRHRVAPRGRLQQPPQRRP